MPLASPSIESHNYRAPGVCTICMQTRTEAGNGTMVDTGIDNDTGFITDRSGRIYVCDECVKELAGLYGFVSEDSVAAGKASIESAQAQLAVVKDGLAEASEKIKAVAATVPDLTT